MELFSSWKGVQTHPNENFKLINGTNKNYGAGKLVFKLRRVVNQPYLSTSPHLMMLVCDVAVSFSSILLENWQPIRTFGVQRYSNLDFQQTISISSLHSIQLWL